MLIFKFMLKVDNINGIHNINEDGNKTIRSSSKSGET